MYRTFYYCLFAECTGADFYQSLVQFFSVCLLDTFITAHRFKAGCPCHILQFPGSLHAKSTIQNIIASLSQAYEYAIDLGYVKTNPSKRIKYPKGFEKSKGREIISVDEYNTIMDAMQGRKPFNLAIMIGWYAGLRISETFVLTWEDIDFSCKTISVNKQIVKRNFGVDIRKAYITKGKKEEKSAWYFAEPKTPTSHRIIIVSDIFRLYYGEYYKELYLKDEIDEKGQPIQRIVEAEKTIPCTLPIADMIFRKENGEYSSTDSFKYPSRVIHHKLGIEKFDYHSLRHTHATMLIEAGVSPKSVQMRLGHASVTTTFDKYVHDTDDMQRSAVDIFDVAMERQQG